MGENTKKIEQSKREFFDCHVHLMNLKHVSFTPLFESVLENPFNAVKSGFLSPVYLSSSDSNLKKNITNALVCFESQISDTIENLYNDLCGTLQNNLNRNDKTPREKIKYIKENNKFVFRNKEYDVYSLIPLCIDFSTSESNASYYKQKYNDLITPFALDTLEGINIFKQTHSEASLNFYPFLGINSLVHSKEKIKSLLNEFCSVNKPNRFYGIKIYPPLNNNPWPIEDKDEWEKIETIYNFAEENNLPLTTHTDNQGFRIISAEKAWKFTDPLSWKYVIKSHPKLRIDFAHFGRFYANDSHLVDRVSSKIMLSPTVGHNKWMQTIISYIEKYDNVYTDLSFSLLDKTFMAFATSILLNKTHLSEKLKKHVMFGTDFAISLLKTSCYTKYLSEFENSNFTDETISLLASENVKNFLFGDK